MRPLLILLLIVALASFVAACKSESDAVQTPTATAQIPTAVQATFIPKGTPPHLTPLPTSTFGPSPTPGPLSTLAPGQTAVVPMPPTSTPTGTRTPQPGLTPTPMFSITATPSPTPTPSGPPVPNRATPTPTAVLTPTLAPLPPTFTPTPVPPTSTPTSQLWRPAPAPANTNAYAAEWISVDVPGGKTMLAAVFRPIGTGPFPAVAFLHGTAGFQTPALEIGQTVAQSGMIGIAVCWFGGHYQGTSNPTPAPANPGDIACPNAPAIPATDFSGITASASQISAFLAAVRTLPGVKSDSIALGGVSRGSIAATAVAFTGESLKALVAVAGYTPAFYGQGLQAPVLVLQGTADTVIPEQDARNFENGLRAQGKTVEAYYYQGAPHEFFFVEPWKTPVRAQAIAFLKAKFEI